MWPAVAFDAPQTQHVFEGGSQGSMGLILRHHLWEGEEARTRKGAGRPGRSGRLVAVLPSPRAETPAGHTRTCLPCVLVRDTLLGALPPSSARL